MLGDAKEQPLEAHEKLMAQDVHKLMRYVGAAAHSSSDMVG